MYHNILPDPIAWCFDLAAQKLRAAVSGFTSHVYKNYWSVFIVVWFFTVTYCLGDIVLLSVNPSGVETIHASIMALYCCWYSHFPEDLCNLLLFPDIYVHTLKCYLRIG